MEAEELAFLTKPETQAWIGDHLDQDPSQLALRLGNKASGMRAAISQIALLQKARRKLPAWYSARCIFTPKAYEQASSEAAASLKKMTGSRCLDLTFGLGVDAVNFARQFEHVTALEPDPVLAEVGRINLQRLGVRNVTLITQTAESFLESYSGPAFDLIYADPDRRDLADNRKIHPANWSPDLSKITPYLEALGKARWIKASPLLDLQEAMRLFPGANRFSVISVNRECKEVWVQYQPMASSPEIQVIAFPASERAFCFSPEPLAPALTPPASPAYIWEPDAAFYHARKTTELTDQFFAEGAVGWESGEGFGFSHVAAPVHFPGRCFEVLAELPFQPKKLISWFKEKGISRLNISKRKFPLTVAQIRKEIRLADGGNQFLICTTLHGQTKAFLAQKRDSEQAGNLF